MKKIAITCVMIFSILMLFGGCFGETEPVEIPEDKISEYNVTLYFANMLYVETGNEDLDSLIEVDNVSLEAKEGEQYIKLVDVYLRNVPEEIENASTLIDDTIVFNSVTVEGGIATVDFASEGMSGGSLSEGYVISQIVESLIVSFEEIQSVKFLINGQEAESLMGHFDITMPYTEGIYRNK